jgi:hypothetical protein
MSSLANPYADDNSQGDRYGFALEKEWPQGPPVLASLPFRQGQPLMIQAESTNLCKPGAWATLFRSNFTSLEEKTLCVMLRIPSILVILYAVL